MATQFTPHEEPVSAQIIDERTDALAEVWRAIQTILKPVASLKLTVVLFVLAIFIVLAGTLAQVDKDIWEVIDDYFRIDVSSLPAVARSSFARVELNVFFPPSFFPGVDHVPGWFPFPKGWLIGLVMAMNLGAAHLVRFKVQARGARLLTGLGVIAVGCLATALVIASGANKAGVQEPLVSYSKLWNVFQVALGAMWVAAVYGAVMLPRGRGIERWSLIAAAVALAGILGYILYAGEAAKLGDPSMRILWQLIKAEFAASILLAGCVLLFRKRAGVVLLHGGIGLMMLGELVVGLFAVETQMTMEEGQTVSFVQDIRVLELAIIDPADPNADQVVVVPEWMLLENADAGEDRPVIRDPQLPFGVQVVRFLKNSTPRAPLPDEDNSATAGTGLSVVMEAARPSAGTDMDSEVDLSAAYVRLVKKESDEPLGTYLVSMYQTFQEQPERVAAEDGTEYDLYLRFKRTYKPYQMTLVDVRKDDYLGTNTPRNYSSEVQVEDEENRVDRRVKIWMNNPLRFAGETFYQSGYNRIPKTVVSPMTGMPMQQFVESTTLQVVTNTGWMIPYVACMIVATGMLAHFAVVLLRFVRRKGAGETMLKWGAFASLFVGGWGYAAMAVGAIEMHQRSKRARRKMEERRQAEDRSIWNFVLPAILVLVCAVYLFSKARPPRAGEGEMDLFQAGKIPVVYEGRAKPLDTLARTSLRVISNKQTFVGTMDRQTLEKNWGEIKQLVQAKWSSLSDKELDGVKGDFDGLVELIVKRTGEDEEKAENFVEEITDEKQPAIRWLLDVIADSNRADRYKIFKIDNPQVLQTLDLERRQSGLYSVNEIRKNFAEFQKQVHLAERKRRESRQLSVEEDKTLELAGRLEAYTMLLESFQLPSLPALPTEEDFNKDPQAAAQQLRTFRDVAQQAFDELNRRQPPLAVPVDPESKTWEAYAVAATRGYVQRQIGMDPAESTIKLSSVFVAYGNNDVEGFNKAVDEYHAWLGAAQLQDVDLKKIGFESFFNNFEPFYYASVLYVLAFILAAAAWLGWSGPLNRAAFWLIVFTLIVHSFALIARMNISGRPPVTNLYSSAVFIGWGCVLLGLLLEVIFRLGIGNVIASVTGFGALLVAHLLTTTSMRGDTFTVMQAVLDTQFWLATHVVLYYTRIRDDVSWPACSASDLHPPGSLHAVADSGGRQGTRSPA